MEHQTHPAHDHEHGESCGHTALRHEDHVDYLHDGHLHSSHGDHVDEHVLTHAQPAQACATHDCAAHAPDHRHEDGCGHEPVPHGDHTDHLVAGHLHNQHGEHCDDHGAVATA